MLITIKTYKDLAKWSEAFVKKGAFPLFFLIGNPGYAKSYSIRELVFASAAERRKKASLKKKPKKHSPTIPMNPELLPENHKAEPLYVEGGAVSAFKLYQLIYTHLNEDIVLDDVDSIYSDRSLVRLLKALCQTEEVKTVGWWTDSQQLEKKGVPLNFRTRSRVCIIANHWHTLSQHVGSLVSRGVMIHFDPPIQEVFNYIKKEQIISDKEILKFVGDNLWMAGKIDIRELLHAVNAKKSKLDWRDALAQSMGFRDVLLVKKLEEDHKNYYNTEQRVREFMRLTQQSRPKYFDAKNTLTSLLKERRQKAGKREVAGVEYDH